MAHRAFVVPLSIVAFGLVTAACNPCKKLDEKICDSLGEDDCRLWRQHDRPGFMGTGRRASRTCVNHMAGSQYDLQLNVVKKSLEGYKNVSARQPTPAAGAREGAARAPATAQKSEHCTALEQKLCTELGDDCAAWKKQGRPGLADKTALHCKMSLEEKLFFKKALEAARKGLK